MSVPMRVEGCARDGGRAERGWGDMGTGHAMLESGGGRTDDGEREGVGGCMMR